MSARNDSSATAADGCGRPIFIIGCPRSGTTLLRMIIDSHPDISCGPESQFLTDLERLTVSKWEKIALFGVDRNDWNARLREFFGGFQKDYMRRRGKKRWADKTPRYTLHLDFINDLFPNAQFVHVIRDGRDVVSSYRDRWGLSAAARAAAQVWSRHVRAAREFSHTIPAHRYCEVRYEHLVGDPEPTLRDLFNFLGENWEPCVLRFNEEQHDTLPRYANHTTQRRELSGDGSFIYKTRIGAGQRELNPILSTLLRLKAGRLLRELGYMR